MKRKLGVALAGGGIRAYVQIGVLKALEEKNVKIDYIAGTSMGSIIAALTAAGATSEQLAVAMLELEKQFADRKVFLRPNLRVLPFTKNKLDGFVDADTFESMIQAQFTKFNVNKIEDLKMPIAITAVDLVSGKLVVFTNVPNRFMYDKEKIIISDGLVTQAVRASCSFPIIFSTKKYEKMQLVDGGVKMNLPVQLLKTMRSNRILSITMDGQSSFKVSARISDVALRIIDLMSNDTQENAKSLSNFNLNIDTSKYSIFDAGKGEFIANLGYLAAMDTWDNIERAISVKTVLSVVKEELNKYI